MAENGELDWRLILSAGDADVTADVLLAEKKAIVASVGAITIRPEVYPDQIRYIRQLARTRGIKSISNMVGIIIDENLCCIENFIERPLQVNGSRTTGDQIIFLLL